VGFHRVRQISSTDRRSTVATFLNPDMIMVDFIEAGQKGLDDDFQMPVDDPLSMAKALLALQRFSLIKWSKETRTLSIHRLVQAVVQDEMNVDERTV
jgi:hypothetical protein